jgi:hypothetical protein
MDCKVRGKFLTFTLNDKKPSSTKWGKEIQGRLKEAKEAK